jgi:hypothetical protein
VEQHKSEQEEDFRFMIDDFRFVEQHKSQHGNRQSKIINRKLDPQDTRPFTARTITQKYSIHGSNTGLRGTRHHRVKPIEVIQWSSTHVDRINDVDSRDWNHITNQLDNTKLPFIRRCRTIRAIPVRQREREVNPDERRVQMSRVMLKLVLQALVRTILMMVMPAAASVAVAMIVRTVLVMSRVLVSFGAV